MKLRKSEDSENEVELNMTPMIDVVFLLIIFFMVVSELSTLNLEEIELPLADESEVLKSEKLDARHIICNVREDGTIRIQGNSYKKEQLADYLKVEADAEEREPANPSNPAVPPSKLYLTIRAHKDTKFENVQNVFDACSQNGIYKTRVMATKDE